MYPECRHVKTNGRKCDSPSVGRSHWCYFHDRLHKRRLRGGRPLLQSASQETASTTALDYGVIPVTGPQTQPVPALKLPILEDAGAIQFALTDVLQALALGTLDPRRAGLLLYGLQIAAQNTRHIAADTNAVRAVTYAEDGSALGPAAQGWDYADVEAATEEDEEEETE